MPVLSAAVLRESPPDEVPRASVAARWAVPVVALAVLVAVAVGLWSARAWPLIHDAPLIHYVLLLMNQGWAPYRDIIEMNMPGTYVLEWLAMHVLGDDAAGWRLWDIASGVVTVLVSLWIAGKGHRWAGLAGGALAYLIHMSDGPKDLGQRDWMVAVLLLTALGCLFESVRRQRPAWMAGFMALCGFAASIKPPVVGYAACFLAAVCWLEWRRVPPGEPNATGVIVRAVGWSVLGGLVPAAIVLIFLWRWGVTDEFLGLLHGLVPWYAGLQRLSFLTLMQGAFAFKGVSILVPMFAGALAVFVMARSWSRWEASFLAAATLGGAVLFLVQGKGWNYHRYPEIVFGSLWVMLELDRGLRRRGLTRLVAALTLVVTLVLVVPRLLWHEMSSNYPQSTILHLESDLNDLGGARLSGHVQCLDMTLGGCINVLYRMKLAQATGFIYDYYLFPQRTNAVTQPLQARFLEEIEQKPPTAIVLSSHIWPGDSFGYEEVANFPAFNELLRQNYHVVRDYTGEPGVAGYRIYLLNTMPAQ